MARSRPAMGRRRHPRGAVLARHRRGSAAARPPPKSCSRRALHGAEPAQAIPDSVPLAGASCLRHAAGISACNTDAATIASEKGFPGRARVIPLGVDLEEFAPTPTAAHAPPTGRVDHRRLHRAPGPREGHRRAADAVARAPRLRAADRRVGSARRVTAGSRGPLRHGRAGRVRRHVRARIRVAGFYRSLDVLAVPSLPTRSWTEQFGRVAVEAMAYGIPVVSSDAGALPDVVGGAGIVVPRVTHAALADALVVAGGDARGRAAHCRLHARARSARGRRSAASTSSCTGPSTHDASASGDHAVEVVVVAFGAPDLLRAALAPVAGMTGHGRRQFLAPRDRGAVRRTRRALHRIRRATSDSAPA